MLRDEDAAPEACGATRIGGVAVREEGPMGAENAERDAAAIMMMSIRIMT